MSNLDEFDTVIRRKGGAAVAAVPRLGLYAQGPDVASALAALEQKKTALVADIDAGLVDADLITKPEQVQLRSARAAGVGVFALKTGIFIVLATLGALVAATLVSAKLEAAIDRVRFAAEFDVLPSRRTIVLDKSRRLHRARRRPGQRALPRAEAKAGAEHSHTCRSLATDHHRGALRVHAREERQIGPTDREKRQ